MQAFCALRLKFVGYSLHLTRSMISYERERELAIFSTVLSQNSKLLVIAQLHPRSIEHLMSNMHLHNTLQHAFSQQFASPGVTCA